MTQPRSDGSEAVGRNSGKNSREHNNGKHSDDGSQGSIFEASEDPKPWPIWAQFSLAVLTLLVVSILLIGLPILSASMVADDANIALSDFMTPFIAVLIALASMSVTGTFVFMTFRIDRGTTLKAQRTAESVARKELENLKADAGDQLNALRERVEKRLRALESKTAKEAKESAEKTAKEAKESAEKTAKEAKESAEKTAKAAALRVAKDEAASVAKREAGKSAERIGVEIRKSLSKTLKESEVQAGKARSVIEESERKAGELIRLKGAKLEAIHAQAKGEMEKFAQQSANVMATLPAEIREAVEKKLSDIAGKSLNEIADAVLHELTSEDQDGGKASQTVRRELVFALVRNYASELTQEQAKELVAALKEKLPSWRDKWRK